MTTTKRKAANSQPRAACVQWGIPAAIRALFECYRCGSRFYSDCLIHRRVDAAGDGIHKARNFTCGVASERRRRGHDAPRRAA